MISFDVKGLVLQECNESRVFSLVSLLLGPLSCNLHLEHPEIALPPSLLSLFFVLPSVLLQCCRSLSLPSLGHTLIISSIMWFMGFLCCYRLGEQVTVFSVI